MAKQQTRQALKKKLWELTSEHVRRRDADDNGYVSCVTCGRTLHWKSLHAGHFIPQAQGDAVRYDPRNIHPQDDKCNIYLGGNIDKYYPYMLDRYGQDVVDELRALSNTTIKLSMPDLSDMIEDMKEKLKSLDN